MTDVEFDNDSEDSEPNPKVNMHVLVMAAMEDAEGDPKSLREARARADWPKWKEAIDLEIETLEREQTWTTVPRSTGKNIVGSNDSISQS